MKLTFLGVRGSFPSPPTLKSVRTQISRWEKKSNTAGSPKRKSPSAEDIHYIGGNTSSLLLTLNSGKRVIFDCGTGLVNFPINKDEKCISIFLTHFHYDHLMGLLYSKLLYRKGFQAIFHSPNPDIEKNMTTFVQKPFHPVAIGEVLTDTKFIHLVGEEVKVEDVTISWLSIPHPNGCFAYKIKGEKKTLIYATDFSKNDSEVTDREYRFFKEADILIMDSYYTPKDQAAFHFFGHSSYNYVVDFATHCKIKKVYLFHHNPLYNDEKIYKMRDSAEKMAKRREFPHAVELAIEGESIQF